MTPTPAPDPVTPAEPELATMAFMDHLRELRARILIAAAAAVAGTAAGLAAAGPAIDGLRRMCSTCEFIYFRPTEAIAAYLHVSVVLGLAIALPIVLYQIVAFVVPGLHRNERRMLYLALPGAGTLFALGLAFGYLVVLPRTVEFLSGFLSGSADPAWSMGMYIEFATNLLLVIGLAFQTPLLVVLLAKLGLATPQRLSRYRRHAILLIAVAAAVLTPTPDPLTMLMVMAPMVLLYEVGILLARIV